MACVRVTNNQEWQDHRNTLSMERQLEPSRQQRMFPENGTMPVETSMSALDELTQKGPASCTLVIGRLQHQGTKVKTKHLRMARDEMQQESRQCMHDRDEQSSTGFRWISWVVRRGGYVVPPKKYCTSANARVSGYFNVRRSKYSCINYTGGTGRPCIAFSKSPLHPK